MSKASKLIERYPDKVPVVIHRAPTADKNVPDLDTKKFLVPRDLTAAQFIHMIRRRIKLDSSRAIYIFFDNSLPSTSELMSSLYDKYKSKEDGILYGTYTSECTFG